MAKSRDTARTQTKTGMATTTSQDAEFGGSRHGLQLGMGVELYQYRFNVSAAGVGGDTQCPGVAGDALPSGQESQDLKFTSRQIYGQGFGAASERVGTGY